MPKIKSANLADTAQLEVMTKLWKALEGPISQTEIEEESEQLDGVLGDSISASYISQVTTGKRSNLALSKLTAFFQAAHACYRRRLMSYNASRRTEIEDLFVRAFELCGGARVDWADPGEPLPPTAANLIVRQVERTMAVSLESPPFVFSVAGGAQSGKSTQLNRIAYLAEARGYRVKKLSMLGWVNGGEGASRYGALAAEAELSNPESITTMDELTDAIGAWLLESVTPGVVLLDDFNALFNSDNRDEGTALAIQMARGWPTRSRNPSYKGWDRLGVAVAATYSAGRVLNAEYSQTMLTSTTYTVGPFDDVETRELLERTFTRHGKHAGLSDEERNDIADEIRHWTGGVTVLTHRCAEALANADLSKSSREEVIRNSIGRGDPHIRNLVKFIRSFEPRSTTVVRGAVEGRWAIPGDQSALFSIGLIEEAFPARFVAPVYDSLIPGLLDLPHGSSA